MMLLKQAQAEVESFGEKEDPKKIRAIRRLIEADPDAIQLPFIRDKMIEILRRYKTSEGPLHSIRLDIWPGFLPNRTGRKFNISDESLRRKLIEIMKMPVDEIINDLTRRKILSEYGYKVALSKIDLSQLMFDIKKKGFVTKELACQIIRSCLPVGEKKLKDINVRGKPGRPRKKIT
jgi:hypothetical protein